MRPAEVLALDLAVDPGDERTGSVDIAQAPVLRFQPDGLGDAVRREDDRRSVRHIVEFVNKDRALRGKLGDHDGIVDNLMPHKDRSAEPRQGFLDGSDRPFHARAKPARSHQQNRKQRKPSNFAATWEARADSTKNTVGVIGRSDAPLAA